MKGKKWYAWLLGVLLLALVPASALAAKPEPFTASGLIAVTSMSAPIPAGVSGRVRIETETIAGITVSGPDELAGKVLLMEQKSNELFYAPDFPDLSTAIALDGSSQGTFSVVNPDTGETIASGRYHVRVSNKPGGCQIYDEGRWATTGGSGLRGNGSLTACLNFDPSLGTFAGWAIFSGTLQ